VTSTPTDPLNFSGKRALITGASRGIGAELAQELAARGAHVYVNYSRDEAGAERTTRAIDTAGGSATPIRANLAHPDDVRAMFEQIAGSGALDVLVHNAAIGSFKRTIEVRANQWDLSMNVNARALLLCAQHAAPLMEGGGGKIVSVSSLGSARALPLYGAIGVTKAALEALTRYLAADLAPRGIGVNAVSAGLVDTQSVRLHPGFDQLAARSIQLSPLARLGTPTDIARVVLFLCSSLSDWIVGQTLVVDGGVSLSL
jgi:enoyl-[acyl-carrier protein] reductase III